MKKFTLDYLMGKKKDLLKSLLVVQRLTKEENNHLTLLRCMFCKKESVIVCYVNCHLSFYLLVIEFLLTILNIQLYLRLKKMTGLNFLRMWQLIIRDRMYNNDENYNIYYLRNNMDTIHYLKYLCFQH